LQLIEASGADVDVALYLNDPLSASDIKALLKKLGFSDARQLIRRGEAIYKAIYKELNLKAESDQNALIEAMAAYPKLIERPIVVKGNHAVLGRPPENVAKFL